MPHSLYTCASLYLGCFPISNEHGSYLLALTEGFAQVPLLHWSNYLFSTWLKIADSTYPSTLPKFLPPTPDFVLRFSTQNFHIAYIFSAGLYFTSKHCAGRNGVPSSHFSSVFQLSDLSVAPKHPWHLHCFQCHKNTSVSIASAIYPSTRVDGKFEELFLLLAFIMWDFGLLLKFVNGNVQNKLFYVVLLSYGVLLPCVSHKSLKK